MTEGAWALGRCLRLPGLCEMRQKVLLVAGQPCWWRSGSAALFSVPTRPLPGGESNSPLEQSVSQAFKGKKEKKLLWGWGVVEVG